MRKIYGILPGLLLATACGGADSVPQEQLTRPSSPAPSAVEREAIQPTAPTTPMAAPEFTFKGSVLTTLAGDVHTATVELVVTDQSGQPAANVEIEGRFTGGIEDGVTLTTNAAGIATAQVSGGKQHMSVGFSVTGATSIAAGVRSPGKVIVDLIYPSPCCPLKSNPTM